MDVLEFEDDQTCSLEEFHEFVARNVEPDDEDSVLACAPMLSRLARNASFFVDFLQRDLKRLALSDSENPYVPTSFILARGDRYVIRANTWKPTGANDDARAMSRLYTYDIPHDHDFTLLTAGYRGSGYKTRTTSYDYRAVRGIRGERVELDRIEHHTLTVGKLMFYAASRDIHEQLAPEQFSISLNLMTWPRNPLPQYLFDIDAGTLVSTLGNGYTKMISVIDIASRIGDGRTASLLEEIATTHQSLRVRDAAFAALERVAAGSTA